MLCDRNAWLFTFAVLLADDALPGFDCVNCCERPALELPLLLLVNRRLPALLLLLLFDEIARLRFPPDEVLDVNERLPLLEERTLAELRLLLLDERRLGPELRDADALLPPRRLCAAASSIVTK